MKRVFTSTLVFALFALWSCADFPTKKFDMNFALNMNVNTSTTSVYSTEILKANTNSDFDKYKNKLNSITINRITFTINSSSLPAGLVINSGKVEFAGKSGNVLLTSLSNFDVISNLGKEVDFSMPTQAAVDEFSELLLHAPNQATVYLTGSTNKGPLVATVKIKFYAKAVARIIGSN